MNEVAIIFGRFQPPHKGHLAAWEIASKSPVWYIGTNQNTIGPKDPLPFDVKMEAIKAIFPQAEGHIVAEQTWLSMAYNVFKKYGNVVLKLVTDEDWVPELITRYNGVVGEHGQYQFSKIETIKPPRLSSASSLRYAVEQNDRATFYKAAGVPMDFEVMGVPYFDLVAKYLLPYEKAAVTEADDNMNVSFHDELNPALWEGDKLNPEVREHLLKIAQDFKEFLGVEVNNLADITISGSNAAFNYTPSSDIDLHLVVDIPKADTDPIYRELFDAKKFQYNTTHSYKIKGYDVELYVQNANDPHYSLGIYSLLKDGWVVKPKPNRNGYDPEATVQKYHKLKKLIEYVLKTGNFELGTRLRHIIKRYRAAGLHETGEFGPENLAFKALRSNGYIEKLYNMLASLKDKELSVESTEGLNEVELYKDIKKNSHWKSSNVTKRQKFDPDSNYFDFEKALETPTHIIYKEHYNRFSEFFAVNKATKLVDIHLYGVAKKHSFWINKLSGRTGSQLKAAEFYHLLITKLSMVLVTYSQSEGGLKVWQKLTQYPDVTVFGWANGHPVNVDPTDPDDTHVDMQKYNEKLYGTGFDKGEKKELDDLKNMMLVAHKKIKGSVKEAATTNDLMKRFEKWPGGGAKWVANKTQKLDRIVKALQQTPFASDIKVFGEAANQDDTIPDDINVFVNVTNMGLSVDQIKAGMNDLIKIANTFHDMFNPYVLLNGKVWMKDPESIKFVQAPQRAANLMAASGKTGVPLSLFQKSFSQTAHMGMKESQLGETELAYALGGHLFEDNIDEVTYYPDYGKDDRTKHRWIKRTSDEVIPAHISSQYGWEELFDVEGYKIYLRPRDVGDWSSFYAFNPSTNKFDMRVTGQLETLPSGVKVFTIEQLDGREGSALKAADFYHALLCKLPMMMVTMAQSLGGLKVWHKLQQFKDIEVYGWNPKRNKATYSIDVEAGTPQHVELDPEDPSDTHLPNDYDSVNSYDADQIETLGMWLVAHKKIRS